MEHKITQDERIEETKVADSQPTNEQVYPLLRRVRSSAGWFTWIAGLSLLNSLVTVFNGNWNFVVGLGSTQLVDGFLSNPDGSASIMALAIDFAIAALFYMFSYFGKKRKTWAFIIGMVIYALDTLIFVWVKDLPSIGFHIYALYWIFLGFNANRKLKNLYSAII